MARIRTLGLHCPRQTSLHKVLCAHNYIHMKNTQTNKHTRTHTYKHTHTHHNTNRHTHKRTHEREELSKHVASYFVIIVLSFDANQVLYLIITCKVCTWLENMPEVLFFFCSKEVLLLLYTLGFIFSPPFSFSLSPSLSLYSSIYKIRLLLKRSDKLEPFGRGSNPAKTEIWIYLKNLKC